MDYAIEQQAHQWLEQQGAVAFKLSKAGGHTNHVYLVEHEGGLRTVLRIANHTLEADLCPLAHQPEQVISHHLDALALGLAPAVLAYDVVGGIMWLEYAGCAHTLNADDSADIQKLLNRLHCSGLDWSEQGQRSADPAGLIYLQQQLIANAREPEPSFKWVQQRARDLYEQGIERGYTDYPVVPVHSDLNSGNCLYDSQRQRWFLIDWDFAGMQLPMWDYASLIVEHGWYLEQGRQFTPDTIVTADLVWCCQLFALLSLDWHQRRGSAADILVQKKAVFKYWWSRKQ